MRRTALFVSAAALVLSTPSLFAQGTPNLAGTWNVVADANAGGGGGRGGRGGLGPSATITQDDKTLTITRTNQNGEIKSVYESRRL